MANANDPSPTPETDLAALLDGLNEGQRRRFQQAVVRQGAHYAAQVLPAEEHDEGERHCLAAVQDWLAHPAAEHHAALERASLLISMNQMERVEMDEAVCFAVWAAEATDMSKAARLAALAVGDAAWRYAVRQGFDYMGGQLAARSGQALAGEWQTQALAAIVANAELPPFAPLPVPPDDRAAVIAAFKAIYPPEAARQAGDLGVLIDLLSAAQEQQFRQFLMSQAIYYAKQRGAAEALSQGSRIRLMPLRRAADEAGLAVAGVERARAQQWQAATAAASARGDTPPALDAPLALMVGEHGAYREGNLAGVLTGLSVAGQLRLKQAVVERAIALAEQALPPEAGDRGHRACLTAARRWLAEPTPEHAAAAGAAAQVEGVPTWPAIPVAESARWVAAQYTAEAAAGEDTIPAVQRANAAVVAATVALEGGTATSPPATTAGRRLHTWTLETAWKLVQAETFWNQGVPAGTAFGILVERMDEAGRLRLAQALAGQAAHYLAPRLPPEGDDQGARAALAAVRGWLAAPDAATVQGVQAALRAVFDTRGDMYLEYAVRAAAAAARAATAPDPVAVLHEAAEAAASAGWHAARRVARQVHVEAAWAILHDTAPPAPDRAVL